MLINFSNVINNFNCIMKHQSEAINTVDSQRQKFGKLNMLELYNENVCHRQVHNCNNNTKKIQLIFCVEVSSVPIYCHFRVTFPLLVSLRVVLGQKIPSIMVVSFHHYHPILHWDKTSFQILFLCRRKIIIIKTFVAIQV